MPPRPSPSVGQPSIAQNQALDILSELLHSFEEFAGKQYVQARSYEEEWRPTAESIVIKAFGQNSTQHSNFARARLAGQTSLGMVAWGDYGHDAAEVAADNQQMFEDRVIAHRASMRAMIRELQMLAPKAEIAGVYDSGNPFAFYRDLNQLLRSASARVMVVDAYLGREIFDLYLDVIPASAYVQVLTALKPSAASLPSDITAVAKIFSANRSNFEIRTSSRLHDRLVIIDDRTWVVGQSIKDAAHKKSTYMVEIEGPEIRTVYDSLWQTSSIVTL